MVRTDNTVLLVDSGIAGKRIIAGLDSDGLGPDDVNGILITHEHSDHVLSLRMMSRKAANADIFATKGTIRKISAVPQERFTPIQAGESFMVGDIEVRTFRLSHDASDPVGYSFIAGDRQLSILTDTGVVSGSIYKAVRNSNAIVLEANHEVNILRAGPYPYELQQRILSDFGHLSNVAAGELLCRMISDNKDRDFEDDPMKVLLAHVSRHNNTPQQAYLTVQNILFENDHDVDKEVKLDVAGHDTMTPMMEV